MDLCRSGILFSFFVDETMRKRLHGMVQMGLKLRRRQTASFIVHLPEGIMRSVFPKGVDIVSSWDFDWE